MMIRHQTETRADTGLYNAKLGIWLFLAFDAMFFGALISAYVLLRAASDSWPTAPAILPMWLGIFHTAVIVVAAGAAAQAWTAVRVGPVGSYSKWLVLSAFGGGIHLLVAVIVLVALVGVGIFPSKSTFHGIYFVLMGVHGLHVLPAVAYSFVYALWGGRMRSRGPELFMNRLECLGLYWQFNAIIGLVLLVLFYLV
jgi:cytochrome c oxidase subunit 3